MICVEKPKASDDEKGNEWNRWQTFLEQCSKLPKPTAKIQKPIENVWLLPLSQCIRFATQFLALSSIQNLHHEVYLLDGEPKLCEYA